jgi:histidyl-tRNA synthetase
VVGERDLASDVVQLKNMSSGEQREVTAAEAVSTVLEQRATPVAAAGRPREDTS